MTINNLDIITADQALLAGNEGVAGACGIACVAMLAGAGAGAANGCGALATLDMVGQLAFTISQAAAGGDSAASLAENMFSFNGNQPNQSGSNSYTSSGCEFLQLMICLD